MRAELKKRVIEIRRRICGAQICGQCETIDPTDPCHRCPKGHWPRHNCKTNRKPALVTETTEERYARTHPEAHRGVSGCCDPPPLPGYGGQALPKKK